MHPGRSRVPGAHDAERRLEYALDNLRNYLILWLLGFSLHIAGGLIHLLLVVALVVLIFNLVTGRTLRSQHER